MTSSILRADGVTAAGGHAPLTFEVGSGRCLGVLSTSPRDTSRLLLTSAGLIKPLTGRVTIAGIDAVQSPDAARRHVAITRRDCIDSRLRLDEYLSAVSQARRAMGLPSRASVPAVVDRLGLDRSKRLSSAVARAEAALAAALMPGVSLVVLDEPFRDISDETRTRAIEWIRTLAAEAVAVVIGSRVERDVRSVSHTVMSVEPAR